MATKLRDLIRNVRACRTQAEEKAVIAKECADIRTSFRSKDDDHLRHRNVAKLLYISMLGYPTHFGQMEAMKLLATQRFAEKRIGYLALMLLLDENQELLMLATNSMKRDLESTNPYIQGLSLCAIGNIASQAIARDLSLDIIKVMTTATNNPYIRKKAALCALRTLRRVEDLVEDYVGPAAELINDRNNSVQMCGIHLMREIVKIDPENSIPQYRLLIPRLCTILRSTWNVSYNPEYDIMGINDPFLQVNVLKFIRTLAQPVLTVNKLNSETNQKEPEVVTIGPVEDDHLERINDTLTALVANIDASKIPGAAIHYEAILAALTISSDQTLRVNSIIQLGKFLQSKDNNIRYISLNTLFQVAQQQLSAASTSLKGLRGVQLRELKQQQHNALTNLEVIQRYRNTIVAYLKDPDPSIRKRALSLIYALVTEKNVRPLVRELLLYLTAKTNTNVNSALDAESPAQNNTFTNIPALVTNSLPYGGGSAMQGTKGGEREGGLGSQSSNAEFKADLTHKIYYIIYQYAPNIIWQLHSMIMLMSTDNEYVNENTFYEFVSLIQNYQKSTLFQQHINTPAFTVKGVALTKQHIDAFIIHELYLAVNNAERVKFQYLVQAFLFLVSQHSQYLSSAQGPQMAALVSQFLIQDSVQAAPPAQNGQPQPAAHQPSLYDPNTYTKVGFDQITALLNTIMENPYTTEQAKQVGLTCVMRLFTTIKRTTANLNPLPTEIQHSLDTLEYILSMHRCNIHVDLQQRASEYLTISRSQNDKLNPVQFSQKIVFPVVNFTRKNLDFDNTDDGDDQMDGGVHQTQDSTSTSASPAAPQVDVFAQLGSESVVEGTVPAAAAPPQSTGLDILNDLLAPAPSPQTTSALPIAAAAAGGHGDADIFAQMAQSPSLSSSQNNNSSNPLDFAFGAIAAEIDNTTSKQHQQQQQQQQQQQTSSPFSDPFGELLAAASPPTPTTHQPQQLQSQSQSQLSPIDLLSSFTSSPAVPAVQQRDPSPSPAPSPTASADPFDMFALASSPSPASVAVSEREKEQEQESISVATPTNNQSLNSIDSFDPLGDFTFSPSSKQSQPTPEPTPQIDDDGDDDFDDFESAMPEEPQLPVEKSIVVFNQNDITVTMVYTANPDEPAGGITYKFTANITTASSTLNAQQMDLRLAARTPLTKTIKVPTSRTLSQSTAVSQELTITNPTTNQEGRTTFKCMFKCVLNGTPFDSPAFTVSV